MDRQQALEIGQIMLAGRKASGQVVTPEVIREVVSDVAVVAPIAKFEGDRIWLTEELERRFKVFVGKGIILEDRSDHVEWLSVRSKEILWQYWPRYRTFLARSMAPESIDRLAELTDDILGRLEDPRRPGAWSRRGLVVGHVQSGKTANYVGLTCKAADAGYKLVVVLAGIHNSLRAQTQMRLEEGFVGYGQEGNPLLGGPKMAVGVGLLDPSLVANAATSRANNGDFNAAVASNWGIHPDPGTRPLLFVVKKNARVLKHVVDWVQAYASEEVSTGRKYVRDVPLLLIDDEADQASIDTNPLLSDPKGFPDPDHEPTRINSLIRKLLYAFEKSGYVGYTATPFANIFIHPQAPTKDEGEDLFPRSFIVNLPAPSNYFGPTKLFGKHELDAIADIPGEPPSLIRFVEDYQDARGTGWMPDRHKSDHEPMFEGRSELPSSLRIAIKAFVLACAARFARGQELQHKTMLVHVTRFTAVQSRVFEQVRSELESLRRRWTLASAQTESEMRAVWEAEFVPTSLTQQAIGPTQSQWEDVRSRIGEVLSLIEIRMINNTSRDVLSYLEHRNTGFHVIAVGGNKLSRGLTLEGLTVSYFLRASRMYDTLMQMGRWFGYRPGYEDLCRLYMTKELNEWFEHITDASEELREEFDRMVAVGQTPVDYGLRVRAHPALMVTSALKMRTGEELELSFAGDILETVAYHKDRPALIDNERALAGLVSSLGNPLLNPRRSRPEGGAQWDGTRLWEGVGPTAVLAFLKQYRSHEANRKVRTELIGSYIQKQVARGELTEWSVALISKAGSPEPYAGLSLVPIERGLRVGRLDDMSDRYQIRRLVSPRDEAIDTEVMEWAAALRFTRDEWQADPGRGQGEEPPDEPSGKHIRAMRPLKRGLMILYPLRLHDASTALSSIVLGLAVSFPESPNAPRVRYQVNGIYYEQEFGPDE
ncbi:MAG: Z1 domain-containing protein [Gemmatimonadetes bacterium]|nr:Z1 domain-containing protein [Gemmatimonadota bacterium]MBK7925496.1 Z1 domain-containing protein [Gemmatimonadota bacterium]HAN92106.1 hypothetical protein [Nitrospira sp.]